MSQYIGKRVYYQCSGCGKQFTFNKRSVEEIETTGNVYCDIHCKAMSAAINDLPVYPQHKEQIENITWEQFIDQLRFAYRDGYLAALNQSTTDK